MWQCGILTLQAILYKMQTLCFGCCKYMVYQLQIYGLPIANICFTDTYGHSFAPPAPLSPLKMASVSHKVLMSLIRCWCQWRWGEMGNIMPWWRAYYMHHGLALVRVRCNKPWWILMIFQKIIVDFRFVDGIEWIMITSSSFYVLSIIPCFLFFSSSLYNAKKS